MKRAVLAICAAAVCPGVSCCGFYNNPQAPPEPPQYFYSPATPLPVIIASPLPPSVQSPANNTPGPAKAPATSPAMNRARKYLPELADVIERHWNSAPLRHVMAGKIEQESSWREKATLRTSRELGRGLAQMTITWKKDGTERFNVYRDAVKIAALKQWDWENDPYNVRYQLTYSVMTDRGNFSRVRPYAADEEQAWKMALVCYNAGVGRWLKRRSNAKTAGLPVDRWDNGLELAYGNKEMTMLYNRPLWQAVNEYPSVVFRKAGKYEREI